MLASYYSGEIYKIVLTGALFICAFVLIKPISALAFLLTYFAIHMTPALVSAAGLMSGSSKDYGVGNTASGKEIKREKNG